MSVKDRYHVVDQVCGLITTTSTRDAAFAAGKNHQEGRDCGSQVMVFDNMAHKGRPHLWDAAQGYIVCTRDRRCASWDGGVCTT